MPSFDARVFTASGGRCRIWYCPVARQQRRSVAQSLRRHLLARELSALGAAQIGPEALTFAAEAGKKPRLLTAATLDFSVSYGSDCVAIGIQQGGCIGVDTTAIDPAFAFASVVDLFFTRAEAAHIAAADPAMRAARFARLWTRKEACLKATGVGVAGLDQRLDVLKSSLAGPPRLYLYDLDPGITAAAALCVATDHKQDHFITSREVLTFA